MVLSRHHFWIIEALILQKFKVAQMSMYDIPIDAELCADFKTVYFCIPMLQIFRVMVILRPKKAPFPQNGPFSAFK